MRTLVHACPHTGCPPPPDNSKPAPNITRDFYLWSDANATWNGTLPKDGDDVTVPSWMTLVVDVGVLTRSIVIRGGNASRIAIGEEQFGAVTLVAPLEKDGFGIPFPRVMLDSVQFLNFGQDQLAAAGVLVRDLTDKIPKGDANVVIRRCAFAHGYGAAVSIANARGVVVENNVVFNSLGPNFHLSSTASQFDLIDNLAISMRFQARSDRDNRRRIAAFTIESKNFDRSRVVGNTAAGSQRIGFKFPGQSCSWTATYASGGVWENNTVRLII
eukprot:tig00021222_g19371.t1